MDNRGSVKFKKKYIIISVLILIIALCIFGVMYVMSPKYKYIDVETSKKNFSEYNDQIKNIFEAHGYKEKIDSVEVENDITVSENSCRLRKTYFSDDVKLCSFSLENQNGIEKFYITFHSPHSYDNTRLLYELSDVLSGYHFTEEDIINVVKGEGGFNVRATRKSDLTKGWLAHHSKTVGFFADWYIYYTLSENDPLYSPDLCDEISIGGLTKTGTKWL